MGRLLGLLAALVVAGACGGESEGIEIEGVAYGLYGERLVGAVVVVDGDSDNLVVTGADGAFRFHDVSAPYTLTIIHDRQLLELHGLRARKLRVPAYGYVIPRQAHIAGKVEGLDFPLPDQQRVLVAIAGKKVDSPVWVDWDGDFQGEIQWDGPSSLDGELVAVQIEQRGDGNADFLLKGARKDVRLSEATNLSGLTVTLDTESHTRETLLLHGPGAYDADYGVWLERFVVQGANFRPFLDAIPSGVRVKVPSEGGTFLAAGMDSDGNQATVVANAALDGTTRIELPVETRLKTVQPVDSEGEDPRPTFLWTPVQGAKSVTLVLRAPDDEETEYRFFLPGKSDRFRLPDYAYRGMGLRRDTVYHWSVTAHMDDGWGADEVAVGTLKDSLTPRTTFRSGAVFRTGR